MQYKARKISLQRMVVDSKGVKYPLCNNCKTSDCDNPIEKRIVSLVGVNEPQRVWCSSGQIYIVDACEGFIG